MPSHDTDLPWLTAAQAGRLIAARELSPVDLTRALLARIEAIDGSLHAFITLTAGHAMAQARAAEAEIARGHLRSPLHGVPYVLKDIIDAAGFPTTGHSKVGIGQIAVADAASVACLVTAGAVLLGKVGTYEYAHGGHSDKAPWPAPLNPWSARHIPGGSSSGTAAAIASGLAPFGLGSDTGGSIRIPAAYCGIVGHKPTLGLVDLAGVFPNSGSLDCCGPLARTVEDCAIVLDAIADPAVDGRPRGYAASLALPLGALRVGVLRHVWEEDVPAVPEMRAAIERVIIALRSLGAATEDTRLRPLLDYDAIKVVIGESEIFRVHLANLRARAADYGSEFLDKILGGLLILPEHVAAARRVRERMFAEAEALFDRYDVLLAVAGGPAPAVGAYRAASQWTKANVNTPFSVLGTPTIALPTGFTSDGLPLACQIVARRGNDAMALRVAHALENLPLCETRRPPLDALTPTQAAAVATASTAGHTPPTAQTRARVEAAVSGWEFRLSPAEFDHVCEIAPHVLAMAERAERLAGS
jgi:aspartyl-tRNA(Asn)/glutamyl-tRNA(Gln) amidotransferase subunit A